MKRVLMLVAAAVFMTAGLAHAGEGKISGYMFGDYYIVAGHYVKEYKAQSGMQFRRIYLTYDYKFDDAWSTRLRWEMSQKDWLDTSAKMEPVVKDAYLKYKFGGTHAGIFGISGTPTWGVVEKFWGYRAVEKTPLDLQGWGSSRDGGIALKGAFDPDKKFGYHVMYGNSESNSHQDNMVGGAYASLYAKPVDGLIVEAYADHHVNDNDCANAGACEVKSSKTTGQLFAGFKGGWGRVGAQFAHQYEERGDGGAAGPNGGPTVAGRHMNLLSFFLVGKFSKKFAAFARYDYIDYPHAKIPEWFGDDANTVTRARPHFAVFGLDYMPIKNIHLMPNVEVMAFGKSTGAEGALQRVTAAGQTARSIVIPRLTVYWKFK